MLLFSLLLWLAFAVLEATATKHGTIGYGINMYHPWCCTACYDFLSMLYLNCTTFSDSTGGGGMDMKLKKRMMGMEMEGSTSDECYASSIPYQQSLSYCVKSHCDAEGISYGKQDKCFQRLSAGGLPVKPLEESLPAVAPTEELAEDAMWLNKTMLVNEAYWNSDRYTIEAFERSEEDHVKFSIVTLSLGVGVPILTGTFLLLTGILPTHVLSNKVFTALRSYLTLPALLNSRHSQPLPFRLGYLPTRPLTLCIALYIILNIIFSSVPFHSVQPNTWFSNRNQEIGAYVANRTGVLSFANMALAILFSTRNNPVAYLCGWTPTTFLTFHRWAARVAIVQAIVHSIVYTIDYTIWTDDNEYDANIDKAYFWWGIIATTAMGMMAGLSALPFRLYAYEFFLVLHIILALLSLLGCWYHVDIRFDKRWGYEVWLYIAFAFWGYDRVVRVAKVVYYNVFSATTAEVKIVEGTRFALLTIRMSRPWSARPGMHTFVYFPSLGRFWENHPFTVAGWGFEGERGSETTNEAGLQAVVTAAGSKEVQVQEMVRRGSPNTQEKGQGQFYIRCVFRIHDGATAKLYQKLSMSSLSQAHVMTEGPYGGHAISHHNLKTAEKILCIAGGIGITFAAGFAKQFAVEHGSVDGQGRRSIDHPVLGAKVVKRMMPRCRQFMLAWSLREEKLLEVVQKDILPDLSSGGLDDESMKYRIWLTRKQRGAGKHLSMSLGDEKRREADATVTQTEEHFRVEEGQRMDVGDVVQGFMEEGRRHVVLVCGPGELSDEVRRQVVAASRRGFVVDLCEENFAW